MAGTADALHRAVKTEFTSHDRKLSSVLCAHSRNGACCLPHNRRFLSLSRSLNTIVQIMLFTSDSLAIYGLQPCRSIHFAGLFFRTAVPLNSFVVMLRSNSDCYHDRHFFGSVFRKRLLGLFFVAFLELGLGLQGFYF